MRGVLAEYIVGLALGCVGSGTRLEWDATERARQADVYVFCVLTPTDKAAVDPLNLDQ